MSTDVAQELDSEMRIHAYRNIIVFLLYFQVYLCNTYRFPCNSFLSSLIVWDLIEDFSFVMEPSGITFGFKAKGRCAV